MCTFNRLGGGGIAKTCNLGRLGAVAYITLEPVLTYMVKSKNIISTSISCQSCFLTVWLVTYCWYVGAGTGGSSRDQSGWRHRWPWLKSQNIYFQYAHETLENTWTLNGVLVEAKEAPARKDKAHEASLARRLVPAACVSQHLLSTLEPWLQASRIRNPCS